MENFPANGLNDLEKHNNVMNTEEVLEEKILMQVANSNAVFKSQQKDEPELLFEEKKQIASDCLHKSHAKFLSRYGKFLSADLLKYFSNDNFEVAHFVNKLNRYFNSTTRQIDVKNRRYAALKRMVENGDYFSETEMMKRNPLLYDNLIGKYLTEEQKKARDNVDTTNITLLNVLLEGIERDGVQKLKRDQQNAEDETLEEYDSDSESNDGKHPQVSRTDSKWGEMTQSGGICEPREKEQQINVILDKIPLKEQNMLRQEFVTQMYQHFLDGKDRDFNYSDVDENESYDNVDLRTQDEEEKYFDSESPEWIVSPTDHCHNESEDELDKYMKSLKGANSYERRSSERKSET